MMIKTRTKFKVCVWGVCGEALLLNIDQKKKKKKQMVSAYPIRFHFCFQLEHFV